MLRLQELVLKDRKLKLILFVSVLVSLLIGMKSQSLIARSKIGGAISTMSGLGDGYQ